MCFSSSSPTPAAAPTPAPPPNLPSEQISMGDGSVNPSVTQPVAPTAAASTRSDRSANTSLKGGSGLNM